MSAFYHGRGDLDRLINDTTEPIESVVAEVERLHRAEEGAAKYYRRHPEHWYPGHPWRKFVEAGNAGYLDWQRDEGPHDVSKRMDDLIGGDDE